MQKKKTNTYAQIIQNFFYKINKYLIISQKSAEKFS